MWSNKICQQRLLYEKWEWMIDRIVLNMWLNWHWKLLERKKKERVWMRSYYVCLVELVEWFLMSSNPMFVYKYGLLQNTSDKKTTHAHENCLHPLLFIHSPSLTIDAFTSHTLTEIRSQIHCWVTYCFHSIYLLHHLCWFQTLLHFLGIISALFTHEKVRNSSGC